MPHIAAQRLSAQQIAGSTVQYPADVVTWLGALQGQVYSWAKWAVGVRLPGSTNAAIEQTIRDGAIVRTWLLRGTLHLVAQSDVRWMLALVAPRLIKTNARRYGQLGLDDTTLTRSSAILADVVHDGGEFARKDLLAILAQHGISTEGQRGVYMLQRASLEGLIVQGIQQGRDAMFKRLAAPESGTAAMSREEALAALARRYFTSRGPATLHDFAFWSGLLMADARAALDAVRAELVQDTSADTVYFCAAAAPAESEPASGAYLLPAYDEYFLGYRDRDAVLDPQHASRVSKGGTLYAMIVLKGRIVGTWSRTITRGAVQITLHPFARLTAVDQEAVAAAARRFGEFLELPAILV